MISELIEEKVLLEERILSAINQRPYDYKLIGALHTEYTRVYKEIDLLTETLLKDNPLNNL